MTQEITLPPLPGDQGLQDPFIKRSLEAYARAAIEADRKRITGESTPMLYTVSEVEELMDESIKPYAFRLAELEADRKRRGEPGLLMVQEADTVPHNHPEYGPGIFFTEDAVISTDPQPAEPVGKHTAGTLNNDIAKVNETVEPVKTPRTDGPKSIKQLINEEWARKLTSTGPTNDDTSKRPDIFGTGVMRDPVKVPSAKFTLGDHVRKTKGSRWQGIVVGTYSTSLTPEGYAVESDTETGSVQIYPAAALERVT